MVWVSAVAKAINYFLRWLDGTVCRGFLPCSPTSLKPKKLAFAGGSILSSMFWNRVDSMVGLAWPRKKDTGLLPVVRFLDGELLGDLSDTGHVLAPDKERHKIVGCGLRIGLLDTVDEADIFRDTTATWSPTKRRAFPNCSVFLMAQPWS